VVFGPSLQLQDHLVPETAQVRAEPVKDRDGDAVTLPMGGQDMRVRKAAVLTRFWHEVEQYRRVPLPEVSRQTRSHLGAVQTPSRSYSSPPSTTARPAAQPASHTSASRFVTIKRA